MKHSIEHCILTSERALEVAKQNKKEITAFKSVLNEQKLLTALLNVKISKVKDTVMKIESQARRDNMLTDGLNESDPGDCTKKLKYMFRNNLKLGDIDNIKIV